MNAKQRRQLDRALWGAVQANPVTPHRSLIPRVNAVLDEVVSGWACLAYPPTRIQRVEEVRNQHLARLADRYPSAGPLFPAYIRRRLREEADQARQGRDFHYRIKGVVVQRAQVAGSSDPTLPAGSRGVVVHLFYEERHSSRFVPDTSADRLTDIAEAIWGPLPKLVLREVATGAKPAPPEDECPPDCAVCGDASPVTIRPVFNPNGFSVWHRDGAFDEHIGALPLLPKAERHRRALEMLAHANARAVT